MSTLSDESLSKNRTLIDAMWEKFFTGHVRTVRTKKNIIGMFALKGVSLVIGFVMVPLTLRYLNPTNYGIWLTLSSVIGWFGFFDIGLGNGLRNKFAEAMAINDVERARVYVSTTYVLLSAVIVVLFIGILAISPLLNWSWILNTSSNDSHELKLLVLVTVGFFCLRFVFGLIGTILVADQKPALSSLLDVLSNLIALGLIWILTITTTGSLLHFGVAIGFSTAIVPILASVFLYTGIYKNVRPSKSYVRFEYGRELTQLGLRFFLLQIGGLVIFSTSNILITQLFSPADVVPYNIAYKYYSIISMMFSIVLTPFWSAYTEAYARGDVPWIRKTFTALKRAWFVTAGVIVVMSFFAERFYRFWIGKEIQIPIGISLSLGAYVLIYTWCNIYANFINGTGKVQLQILSAISVIIFSIPLAIFLSKSLHFGIPGIVIAPSMLLLPWCVVWPVQVKKILSGNAVGIWSK